MSPNRYLNYYQGNLHKARPGFTINQMVKDAAVNKSPSEKQCAYYKDLLAFCEAHGVDVSYFKNARTKYLMRSSINGLITTIKKNGLWDEWTNPERRKDADIQNE